MNISRDEVYNFAHRLNYNGDKYILKNFVVDNVNKTFDERRNPILILANIILWNVPICVRNMIKQSYEYTYKRPLTWTRFLNTISLDIFDLSIKYRNKDIFKILHPYINKDAAKNYDEVISILLSKVLDREDNYFNKDDRMIFISNKLVPDKYNDICLKTLNTEFTLSGSLGLALTGQVHRLEIKDVDLLVSSEYLDKDILNNIIDEITINKVIGKERERVENNIKDIFEHTAYYDRLKYVFKDIKLKSVILDKLSDYDIQTKAVFVFDYNGIEVDIIFKDDIDFVMSEYKEGMAKVQNPVDILYNKRLLGRRKDFIDIINYKPYYYIDNTDKCQIEFMDCWD